MRIVFELLDFRLELQLLWYWTRWFLPIHIQTKRFPHVGMLTISFLWVLHLHLKIPLPLDKRSAGRLVAGDKYL